MLLCYTQDQLFHGFGRILLIIHLWIIVGCIYNHIIINILLCIQIVSPKDRLAIIWSKRILIAARRVRKAWSKIQNIYSRGGVPHAYLTQNRRLQRLRKLELVEEQVEVEPTEPTAMKKIWRPKQIVSSSTWSKSKTWPIFFIALSTKMADVSLIIVFR